MGLNLYELNLYANELNSLTGVITEVIYWSYLLYLFIFYLSCLILLTLQSKHNSTCQ